MLTISQYICIPKKYPKFSIFSIPTFSKHFIPKKCLKFSIFSLPCFTIHKHPPKYNSHAIIFFPASQYILISKKYPKFSCFYHKFNNTFLSLSWTLSGLLHCAHPICLMLCLSGSRSHSKIIEQNIYILRSNIFAIARCTISHNWPPKLKKIFFAIAGHTGCTEHFLQLATNKFLMSISSEFEFKSYHFYDEYRNFIT